ncbi:MAG TPA: tetraacyldisaccharide 4'-kinase [Planctomycetota bacterium]|nr:tetraacyldisaccharide 4'-kinase [Planctomycetota bacterium]
MGAYVRDVIEGRRRGPGAAVVRALLSAASAGYAVLHGLHRWTYLMGLARPVILPVPVISVGNISAGGTGKTPLVEWVVRRLERRRLRVAVLARGYGRRLDGGDDEDLLGSSELVRRYAHPDRAGSGRRAVSEFHPDAIVLDDGFQHYRLHRDLDLVTVDATNPFGHGRLLPRGLLRDRPSALRRAHAIVLTRTDQVTPSELASIHEDLARHSLDRPVIDTVHRPAAVRTLADRRAWTPDWLKGRRVFAFCGVGNPGAFRRTLESAGAEVVKFRAFPDHHVYRPAEARQLEVEAQEFMAGALVTTEKDATKLDASAFRLPVASLRVELEAVRGGDRLEALLESAVRTPDPAIASI